MSTTSLSPRLTLSKLCALPFAAAIHSVTVLCAIGGLWLLVRDWPNPFAIVAGIAAIGVAVTIRPRFGAVPKSIVSRQQAPALYALCDRVAAALASAPVYAIVVDGRFNASFSRRGWRRCRVLCLGLPLLSILNPQERVALIAHELAHDVNGDPNRGFFVGSAVNALAGWHYVLRPSRIWNRNIGSAAFGAAIGNMAALALSYVPRLSAFVLSHLLWRDTQRAEYLADHLAAQVAGTDAALSLLDKLHCHRIFTQTVRTATLNQRNRDLFDDLRQRIAGVPDREMERIRRVERLAGSRLDATHPPTPYRVEFLEARFATTASVTLTQVESEQIDCELAPYKAPIQHLLLDTHRRSLYR